MASGLSAGSSRALRLDPLTLPVRYSAQIGGMHEPHAAILLDRDRALVRRATLAGTAITLDLPLGNFEGVAVRMLPVGEAGELRVTVELLHRDPSLTLPLMVAAEPADVAADWQAWGEALNLPLLLIDHDGTVIKPAIGDETLIFVRPKARRLYGMFTGLRGRFLRRRKPGRRGPMEIFAGREIIARN